MEASDKLGVMYFYNIQRFDTSEKNYTVEMCTYSNKCSDYGNLTQEAGNTGRFIVPENDQLDTYFTDIKNFTFTEIAN